MSGEAILWIWPTYHVYSHCLPAHVSPEYRENKVRKRPYSTEPLLHFSFANNPHIQVTKYIHIKQLRTSKNRRNREHPAFQARSVAARGGRCEQSQTSWPKQMRRLMARRFSFSLSFSWSQGRTGPWGPWEVVSRPNLERPIWRGQPRLGGLPYCTRHF